MRIVYEHGSIEYREGEGEPNPSLNAKLGMRSRSCAKAGFSPSATPRAPDSTTFPAAGKSSWAVSLARIRPDFQQTRSWVPYLFDTGPGYVVETDRTRMDP